MELDLTFISVLYGLHVECSIRQETFVLIRVSEVSMVIKLQADTQDSHLRMS